MVDVLKGQSVDVLVVGEGGLGGRIDSDLRADTALVY